jgi:hypothetical protein
MAARIWKVLAALLNLILITMTNLPPTRFLITLGDKSKDVYFSDDADSTSDEWVASNVIIDPGRIMQVWRHTFGSKRTVWVVIPIHGGYVVTKISTQAKRATYNVETRKLRGRPDHAIATIMCELLCPALTSF